LEPLPPGSPLTDFVLALPVLVFSLVAHEYAHGAAAFRQGDDTAYMLGRLTLNPLPHIDPWLSLLMPALLWFGSGGRYTFGGAKPIPVNPRKYRNYKRGDIIVSAAGVVTNLLLSLVFSMLFIALGLLARAWPAAVPTLDVGQRMMVWGVQLNLVLACFNAIPIPPLDGSHLFYYLLPPGLGDRYRSLQRFGFLPLLAILLLFQPLISWMLTPAWWILKVLLGFMLPWAVGDGWNIFAA
jgi:Zn-dependent protease